jgi:hypothetical protein
MLQMPAGHEGVIVRCAKCQERFRVPRPGGITDDTITSWLSDAIQSPSAGDDDLETSRPTQAPVSTAPRPAPREAPREAVFSAPQVPTDAVGQPIRLVKFGDAGALMEFQAARLREVAFRTAMPRRCLRCGTPAHLLAHVIVYSPVLVDNVSLEAEHAAGELRLAEDQTRDLNPEQLLERLPMVPNVPAPGNLPMPYWVCDMCSGAGLISGQIQVNTQTGNGLCKLRIRNLRRALEFLEAAGGGATKAFKQLLEHVESSTENPWEQLPSMIQHRVEQWYKPAGGEQYIAYVPDRDRTRTEDGMSGLLISNRRLIFHTRLRHSETTSDKPLKLQLSNDGGKLSVKLETPIWDIKHLVLDRDGANLLRRALVVSGFKPVWE